MKIALVNYRYFLEGGPERYMFNVTELLERMGHEVVPFSIKNSRNRPTPYEHFFLDGVDDEVRYDSSRQSPAKVLKSFGRMFYSFEAKRKFREFLKATKPDIIYIIHYHNKISPSILDAAREEGIKVVHRISDFQYLCPNALFFSQGRICESCLNGSSLDCIRKKCVLNSTVFSAIKLSAMKFHNFIGAPNKVNAFVVPSQFTLNKLVKGGLPADRMNRIPTFFNLRDSDPVVTYGDYFVFVGRLTPQKGLNTLLRAFESTNIPLKVIGAAPDGYGEELRKSLEGKNHKIEFLGHLSFEDISKYLRRCRAMVMTAEGYDNFPNVILESFGFKKPVIASACGSLPEAVIDGVTGLTFRTADPQDLAEKVNRLAVDETLAEELGKNAWHRILTDYSPEAHYNQLIDLFHRVISSN